MRDVSDRREIRKAEKASKLHERQDNEIVAQIMAHPNGRAWFYRLLGDCGIYQSPISPNPHFTYHNVGKQDVGRALLAQITTACPDEYIQMLREADQHGRSNSSNNGRRNPSDSDGNEDGSVVSEYEPADRADESAG